MSAWMPSPASSRTSGSSSSSSSMLVLSAAFMVWMERKVCAYIQDRVGPNRVGSAGWLQPFADVIKLMTKEELRPKAADALLFSIAPVISADRRVRRLLGRAVRHRDDAVRAARRAAAAAGDRRQRRRAGALRHHLDGRLRHRPRRLELEQQVLAARRAALVGADDQLRAVVRPGAGGGDHAGRLAVAARDRADASRATGGASSPSGTSSCSRSASSSTCAPASPRPTARRSTSRKRSRSWSPATTPSTAR